ncbi:Hypothetical predicted protein [Cloeon dipterum]|uniref:Pseudouridine synthase I TruA alpha/beta domain-containing protein n=1 Tax=Cloeon dipterum TaxID=197152 RepID=A0A8S1C8W7_9INSE|nr:Hypothetical predicted protein [Cloeon dipterum]
MAENKKQAEFSIDRKISKFRTHLTPEDELKKFSHEELVARVQQLEAYTYQLKNIIKKSGSNVIDNVTLIGMDKINSDTSGETCTLKKKNRPFDFSKCSKRRILLRILYLGWDLDGYAVQDNSTKTIEHHLFLALTKSCLIQDRQSSNYHRCGRTDKGVSAFSQVISIDVRSKLPSEATDLSQELPYCKMLNRLLPDEIRVLSWAPAPSPEFSARFDCVRRKYRYFFPRGSLDLGLMGKAAALLVGGHDFRNFCKMDVGNGVVDYKRSIFQASVTVMQQNDPQLESPYDMCEVTIEGKAFLWHQIRCIVSVLFLVGEGKEEPQIVTQLLNPEQPKPQYPLAVDLPLVLFECEYEHLLDWQHEQEELSRVVLKMQATWTANAVKAAMIGKMLANVEPKLEAPVLAQADSLVMGVKPKVYQPLLKRQTCCELIILRIMLVFNQRIFY